jgi:hypothetical protein
MRSRPHVVAVAQVLPSGALPEFPRVVMFVPASAKGAVRTTKSARNSSAPRSVLREFLRSAKGATRTTKPARNCFVPRSVLREFLKVFRHACLPFRHDLLPSRQPAA